MTSDKRRKARIRARMARTGERYTTARHHILDTAAPVPRVLGYQLRGGQHPDSAVLANVLAHAGVTGPDGAPLSEAMVFGVMGGLGAGYILWEFAHDDSRAVALGFRNQWQYFDRAVVTALQHLGVDHDRHTTSGPKRASERLDTQLDSGRPALIWPDRYLIGYWQLPPALDGHGGHPVAAIGRDDGRVAIDDRTSAPLTVERDALDRARARVGSYRNTLIDPRPVAGPLEDHRLRAAVLAGIDDCVTQLRGHSTSFSLPAWRSWARMMTDTRNAKGWPNVFADGVGLAGALLSVWEGTSQLGMTGGHLRDLYAAFLEEAGPILGTDLDGVVVSLRAVSEQWTALGDTAVDRYAGPLARLRELTATIRQAIAADGDSAADEARQAGRELWALRNDLDASFPQTPDEIASRFEVMGHLLSRIFELETRAIEDLATARAAFG